MTRASIPPVIPSLDGFRALSIIIVTASHCGFGQVIPGGLGVTIFFFLSGYLISTLLLQEYSQSGTINIGHFYLRRVLRLYPPLLVTLLFAYGAVWIGVLGGGVSWAGLMSQLFYFANYYQLFFDQGAGMPDGTGILWSLAVEEHFYLVYPMLFLALAPASRRLKATFLLGGLCVLALLWRVWLVTQLHVPEARTYFASDTRFDSILFGCVLAFIHDAGPAAPGRAEMTGRDWVLLGLGVSALLGSLVFRNAAFRESLRYTIQGVSLMPLFHFAIRFPAQLPFRWLNHPLIRRIGVYSYSIYLIHLVIANMLAESSLPKPAAPALLLIVFSAACAYAYVIDRFVDSYFKALRKALH